MADVYCEKTTVLKLQFLLWGSPLSCIVNLSHLNYLKTGDPRESNLKDLKFIKKCFGYNLYVSIIRLFDFFVWERWLRKTLNIGD